jgi:hypothetical protein
LSKPLVRKGRARKSKTEGAKDDEHPEVRFMRLENIPIANAFHEKAVFEKGQAERSLNPNYFSGLVAVSKEARRERIVEVYRRCYEESGSFRRLRVIRDFIAHFPHMAFDADWLKELIKNNSAFPRLANDNRNEILLAIANGFRSAASANPRESAIQKAYKIFGVRMTARAIQDDLSTWSESLERPLSTPEEIEARATEKVEELVESYPMSSYDRQRLKKFLQKGHCYQAANLITSKVFGVRERDLESKSD